MLTHTHVYAGARTHVFSHTRAQEFDTRKTKVRYNRAAQAALVSARCARAYVCVRASWVLGRGCVGAWVRGVVCVRVRMCAAWVCMCVYVQESKEYNARLLHRVSELVV